jgi:hypothetical protein
MLLLYGANCEGAGKAGAEIKVGGYTELRVGVHGILEAGRLVKGYVAGSR